MFRANLLYLINNSGHFSKVDEMFLRTKELIRSLEQFMNNVKIPKPTGVHLAKPKPIRAVALNTEVFNGQKGFDREILLNPENAPKVIDMIQITFDLHFNPEKRVVCQKSRRGRPEDIKDCSSLKLKSLLKVWENELMRRLNRDQRSDAFFASVGRYIKKIPDVFLKYIGSKCQYKAKDIRIVLRSYLKSFLCGFIVLFPTPEGYDQVDVFCDYCILAFPDSKVQTIFEEMKNEGSITDEMFLSKLDQLKIRIKASKMSYKDLWNSNKCFQIICSRLPEHFTDLDGDNLKRILNVLQYLNSPGK
jgi:hypothetical protein